MENIFLCADTHFSHHAIIKCCNRPFDNIEEMNETIINNWNSMIGNNDIVYHLGDFMMGLTLKNINKSFDKLTQLVGRLNGKIHLISGNHDKILIKLCRIKNECPFEIIENRKFIKSQGRKITLTHKALNDDYTLHGHSHTNLSNNGYVRLDVGIDNFNYYPVSLENIMIELKSLEYKQYFH